MANQVWSLLWGGKWTTYRLMAQEVSDLVCRKLGVARECRTHLEALPGCEIKQRFWPGTALQRVEQTAAMSNLVCECELVTVADVFDRLEREPDVTLHRLRQLHRLGMGSCQGGVCTYRATGLLHMRRRPSVSETNRQLADFLQERWKGMWPVLWGRQLRQVCFNQVLYVGLLGADRGMNALETR